MISLVGSDSPNTTDLYVLDGAGEANRAVFVRVIRPRDSKGPFEKFHNKPDYRFIYDEGPGRWLPVHGKHVNASDVVLLIGGGSGTRDTASAAYEFHRPLLPIHYFGESSAEIFNQRMFDRSKLNAEEWELIATRWDRERSPRVVVIILERMARDQSALPGGGGRGGGGGNRGGGAKGRPPTTIYALKRQ